MPMLKATPNALCASIIVCCHVWSRDTVGLFSVGVAVRGLTEALSLELEGDDIRVMCCLAVSTRRY